MDVEKNPGPGPDHTYTSMLQNMQAAMEWRFSELMGSLQSYTAGISQKMDDNFGRLDRTLGQLLEDVVGLKTAVQQHKEDIRELQEDRDKVTHRLDRTEKELDSLERLSKHCNLKFLGVTEGLLENYRTSIERIVDILNECSSSRTSDKSDIETAHRIGIRVSSELTTRQRDEVQRYRRQGKIAYYKNGRLQVEERRADPAVDSRRRNSLRDTNDDQEGREWTGRYHSRPKVPSTGTRQSSHDPADPRRSRPPGTTGVSRYGSRDRERDWNYISQTRNNAKEQKRPMNADDSSGRHQHYHQDSNAWYERQQQNPGPCWHRDPWHTTVDYNHGEDPWMVQDKTGNDHGDYKTDDWEQTHVKEPHDGTNSNTANGNGSTVHRHRRPSEELCRQQNDSRFLTHQQGSNDKFTGSNDYHHISPGSMSYTEVLRSPAPPTKPAGRSDRHLDPVVHTGETQTAAATASDVTTADVTTADVTTADVTTADVTTADVTTAADVTTTDVALLPRTPLLSTPLLKLLLLTSPIPAT